MPRIQGTLGPNGRYLPQTTVSIVVKHQTQSFTALIDSGADKTIVPRLVVEALGVDYDRLPEAKDENGVVVTGSGASGDFPLKDCRGKVRWRMWTITEKFWVGPTGAIPFVLLGRDDFFQKFTVAFDWSKTPPYMDIDLIS